MKGLIADYFFLCLSLCVSFGGAALQAEDAVKDVSSWTEPSSESRFSSANLLRMGIDLMDKGDYSSALMLLEQALSSDPANELALKYREIAKEKLAIELARLTQDVISDKNQQVIPAASGNARLIEDPELKEKVERVREAWRKVWAGRVEQNKIKGEIDAKTLP